MMGLLRQCHRALRDFRQYGEHAVCKYFLFPNVWRWIDSWCLQSWVITVRLAEYEPSVYVAKRRISLCC